jgi:hypothetical protein
MKLVLLLPPSVRGALEQNTSMLELLEVGGPTTDSCSEALYSLGFCDQALSQDLFSGSRLATVFRSRRKRLPAAPAQVTRSFLSPLRPSSSLTT